MIPIEVSDKPWWGPRARARNALAARSTVLSPTEAVGAVTAMLGQAGSGLQHARCIDFVHRQEGFRYTIMLLWTDSDSALRDAIYELATKSVFETGWYPLPMGERLSSVRDRRAFQASMQDLPLALPSVGVELRSIESAVPVSTDGGCSIRIRTDAGNVLLDSGLPGALQPEASDRILLLTHAHNDHAGGLSTCLDARMTVVTSAVTAQCIAERDGEFFAAHRQRIRIAQADLPLELGGIGAIPFSVPHCPGSVGFEVRDGRRAVFFTGDICLRSRRHDFLPQLQDRIRTSRCASRLLLLDATMAGRTAGASQANSAASLLSAAASNRDILVTSQIPEHLCYAYLDTFHGAQNSSNRHQFHFLLSGRLRAAVRMLHASFIDRDESALDRFLDAQYGAKRQAWGESRWCYWLDRLRRIPDDGRTRIYFIPHSDLGVLPPIERGAAVQVGRGALPEHLMATGVWSELSFDSTPWTAHSDNASLVDAIAALKADCRVVLFHDFPGRLRKFVRRSGHGEDVLSETPLLLSSIPPS